MGGAGQAGGLAGGAGGDGAVAGRQLMPASGTAVGGSVAAVAAAHFGGVAGTAARRLRRRRRRRRRPVPAAPAVRRLRRRHGGTAAPSGGGGGGGSRPRRRHLQQRRRRSPWSTTPSPPTPPSAASAAPAGAGDPPAPGYGGAVFAVNGTLTATFDTFSAQHRPGRRRRPHALDGTDIYVLSDDDRPASTAHPRRSTLTDDILGQAERPYQRFRRQLHQRPADARPMTRSARPGQQQLPSTTVLQQHQPDRDPNVIIARPDARRPRAQWRPDPDHGPAGRQPGPRCRGRGRRPRAPATPITTDQRGSTRLSPSGVDIGAFQTT